MLLKAWIRFLYHLDMNLCMGIYEEEGQAIEDEEGYVAETCNCLRAGWWKNIQNINVSLSLSCPATSLKVHVLLSHNSLY